MLEEALAREAILQRIADLEDCCLADMRARKRRDSIPLTEMERQLGLRR